MADWVSNGGWVVAIRVWRPSGDRVNRIQNQYSYSGNPMRVIIPYANTNTVCEDLRVMHDHGLESSTTARGIPLLKLAASMTRSLKRAPCSSRSRDVA
jgi:hypothetical protein